MEDEGSEVPRFRFGDGTGSDAYRTCAEPVQLADGTTRACGRDCAPQHHGEDGLGIRLVFECPVHGIHSVVDPFADMR